MKEEWKSVIGLEDCYEVSNLGNVRSIDKMIWNGVAFFLKKGYQLTPKLTTFGYNAVYLGRGGKHIHIHVHRLVAIAFVENPYNKKTVNHIDGDRFNNEATNLEWCTQKENVRHAWANNLCNPSMKDKFGKDHHSSIKIGKFDENGQKVSEFYGINEAIRMGEIGRDRISKSIKTGDKASDGFYWKRID